MAGEGCEWEADIFDDTLKELFISQTMYCEGKREVAMIRLAAQSSSRIPVMVQKARHEGIRTSPKEVKELQGDVQRVIDAMKERQSCHDMHELVMKLDKKYALPNFYRFSRCIHQ